MGVILLVVVGVLAVNGDGAGECTGDDGAVYSDGDSFIDDCNRCRCSDGAIACTKKACPSDGCEANGVTYQPGDSYVAEDGCNNCFCTARGVGACTQMAC